EDRDPFDELALVDDGPGDIVGLGELEVLLGRLAGLELHLHRLRAVRPGPASPEQIGAPSQVREGVATLRVRPEGLRAQAVSVRQVDLDVPERLAVGPLEDAGEPGTLAGGSLDARVDLLAGTDAHHLGHEVQALYLEPVAAGEQLDAD